MTNDKKLKTPFGFNIDNFLHPENHGFSDCLFLIKARGEK